MANPKKYLPEHPGYTGNQIVLSSDRVTLHSREDSIMCYGKKAISLASLGTVNFDVTDRVIINAPKIELGLEAEVGGQPVLLGQKTVDLLERLLNTLQAFGKALAEISETELAKSIPKIAKTGTTFTDTCPKLIADLKSLLSNVTYTK